VTGSCASTTRILYREIGRYGDTGGVKFRDEEISDYWEECAAGRLTSHRAPDTSPFPGLLSTPTRSF
jgi:hypothetical protein